MINSWALFYGLKAEFDKSEWKVSRNWEIQKHSKTQTLENTGGGVKDLNLRPSGYEYDALCAGCKDYR